MLNKKLVIAALLAVAQADDTATASTDASATASTDASATASTDASATATTDTASTDASATATTDAAATTDTASTDTASTDAAATTDATATTDTSTTDTAAKPEKEAWPEQDFDKARAAWKETIDGTELVLCDQGDSKVWQRAAKKLEDLVAAAATAATALTAATDAWTPLNTKVTEMNAAKLAHTTANAAYLTAYDTAQAKVNSLVAAAAGTDGTSAATSALGTLTALTDAAEAAVLTQRERVEKLIDSKRTQDLEESAWATRVAAALTAKNAADTAKTTADAAVAANVSLAQTRSNLMTTLGLFDSTNWAANCQASNNAKCEETETARADTSSSTWAWPTNCDYNDGSAKKCTMYALKGTGQAATDGLYQAIVDKQGTARVTGASPADPKGYEKDLEDVDYESTRGALATNAGDSGVSKRTNALTTYLAWQKRALLVEAMNVACWKAKAGGTYASGDQSTMCATGATLTSGKKFHPLMQSYSGSTTSQNDLNAGLAALKDLFDKSSSPIGPHITPTMVTAKATAQVQLWNAGWVAARYTAVDAAITQDKIPLDATATEKATMATAALNELDAAKRWEIAAAAEAVAANSDLATARALLSDLTDEIAPLARAETSARTALATAVAEQAARVVAGEELGTAFVAANATTNTAEVPATGARAVLLAAQKTKESVDAQQAFHNSRAEWADDNLAPAALVYGAAQAADVAAKAAVVEARAKMEAAKSACKVAAFGMAQAALAKDKDFQDAKAAKVAEVKKTYEGKAAMPDSGAEGTLCNIPKPVVGEPAQARKECLEGEPGKPLCCGAAQRFLKDGTKLSVETCQLATATTYTYYPALPDGALVAPTPETWRFQCISAAQKLAAAATAALAAGYMMA